MELEIQCKAISKSRLIVHVRMQVYHIHFMSVEQYIAITTMPEELRVPDGVAAPFRIAILVCVQKQIPYT